MVGRPTPDSQLTRLSWGVPDQFEQNTSFSFAMTLARDPSATSGAEDFLDGSARELR
jgi:hypothetical protein